LFKNVTGVQPDVYFSLFQENEMKKKTGGREMLLLTMNYFFLYIIICSVL